MNWTWLQAMLLTLILVLTGIVVIVTGVIAAIAGVQAAIEEADVPTSVVGGLFVIVGAGIVLGGWRFITRVRPWAVRRLCGRDVPRVPAALAAMVRGPGGEWSDWGDGD